MHTRCSYRMTDVCHSGALDERLRIGAAVRQTDRQAGWLIGVHSLQDTGVWYLGIWYFDVEIRDGEYHGLENGDLGLMFCESNEMLYVREEFHAWWERMYGGSFIAIRSSFGIFGKKGC